MKGNKYPYSRKGLKKVRILEDQLTTGQKQTWNNIRRGFIELKMAEEGKLKFRPIQELLDEI